MMLMCLREKTTEEELSQSLSRNAILMHKMTYGAL